MTHSAQNAVSPPPAEILADLRSPIGLYVHVPFCASICPFCPYNKVLHHEPVVRRYFDALNRELDRYLECFDGQFTSLYVGGGTPTLCIEELARLLARIPVAGERGIEVLPTHADSDGLDRVKAAGFDYLSLGLQSFDPGMLQHLHRPHDRDDNLRALEQAVGRFACVDADLLLDVGFESEETFLADLETCLRAGVDQVSSYPLMRFGYTPFGKARHDRRAEHRVLRAGERLAESLGYERRAVWTFNRVGSSNFTSITREFYLGLGAGAASYTGREFLVNHFSIDRYIDKLDRGCLPIARRASLGELKSAVYYLFWQAYTGSIDLRHYEQLFRVARLLRPIAYVFAATGHVRIRDGRVELTPRGYDLYHDLERWVTYHFIEPLWEELMREHGPLHAPASTPSSTDWLWQRLAGVQPVGSP
jgi:oxygen-independent coproporphyrinogen-3 oxidase